MIRIRVKIRKGKIVIDKTITIKKSSVNYFLSALKKYGWEVEK